MAMITGARVVPAVNHGASSTLPAPLVPENKYATVYLLSASDKEDASKRPRCKSADSDVPQSEIDTFQQMNDTNNVVS